MESAADSSPLKLGKRDDSWRYGVVKYTLWGAWRIGRKVAFSVPPVGLHLATAHFRGKAHASLHRVPQHVLANIEAALGTECEQGEAVTIARRYFAFTKRLYLERVIPMLPGFSRRHPWKIAGLSHLDDALAKKRGVMIVTAHLGFSRLIVPLLRAHGYDVKQVVAGGQERIERRVKQEEGLAQSSRFRRYIHERTRILSDRIGVDEIVAGLDVRPILKALDSNRPILIAGDGVRAAEFVKLPLLNKTYPFPVGFMKIAMTSGATVLPAFAVEEGREIVVEIHPPIQIDPKTGVSENLSKFAGILDRQLRQTPYLWSRWGVPNLFDKAHEWSGTDLRLRHTASRSL